MSDYQDEFRTVRARFAKNLWEGSTIRLDPASLVAFRTRAKELGIGPAALARI